MIAVGTNGSLTLTRLIFVYNVLASGNFVLISTVEASASVTLNACSFLVNGTSAVVPESVISHGGGSIFITSTLFEDISLGAQPLISFNGIIIIIIFFLKKKNCFYYCFCFFSGMLGSPSSFVDPLLLNISETNFTNVE
jgi:hypothetical protein